MLKKTLPFLLLLVLLFGVITVFPISVSAQEMDIAENRSNVELSETGTTQSEAVAWANSKVGQALDYDGANGAQCVDFIMYYYQYLGVRSPGGNGKDYAWNSLPSGWIRTFSPQPGDIAVWTSGDWGHVAIVTELRGSQMVCVEQNYAGKMYVTPNLHNIDAQTYIRPNFTSNDKTGPAYDDFHVGELQSSQFTVMAHVTDPSGVRSVSYAVWTTNNGQDELKWYDGHCTDGNDYYWAWIPFSEHYNEKGSYIIDMYAYDNAGNLTTARLSYNFDSSGPAYSDFHVGEFREGAFTILAKVTDINGVGSVKYAVWTEKDGQDDLKWYDGHCTDGNDYYWARINFSDHKGEKGKYIIHMYAYDVAGKLTQPGISYVFPETGPTVTDVNVSDVSSTGYTVTCTVTSDVGVSRVQFPTWTDNDGQDDLAPEWWTNQQVRGTINGDTVTFRVKTSEHNRETRTYYYTHLYAYDIFGTATKVVVPAVMVPSSIYNVKVTDVDESGYTVTCDIDTAWGPVNKVEFPTWTVENGQDDLIWYQGTYSNGKATCRIQTKDHNNALSGVYITHIYVWDNDGHNSSVNQSVFPCLSFEYSQVMKKSVLGDVDGDEEVTIIDATAIQRHLASIPTASYNEKTADADEDGEVTIIDATAIQRYLAQLPSNENIGKLMS